VAQQFDSIVAFAELEQFIDNPLRTYSTGMQMRLAFAVAAHIKPEVLLIDEVLAVGDIAFQHKCLKRIAQFKDAGCTILLVSHDTEAVRQLCDEALWLRGGQLVAHGPAGTVVDQYVSEMTAETQRRTQTARPTLPTMPGVPLQVNQNRFGSFEMELIAVRLLNRDGVLTTEIDNGDPLQVELEYLAGQPIQAPIFGVTICREDGVVCYDTSTVTAGLTLPSCRGRGQIILHLERLDLNGGQYYIDVGVYERNWAYAYDYHWRVYPLTVRSTPGEKGVLRPPHYWEVGYAAQLPANLAISRVVSSPSNS
jgi:lipopolysaccharide transport system ATP-binding protein